MLDYSFSMAELEYFLLILMRCASFVYVAPFFGNRAVPGRVKIGFSVMLAVLLYYVLTPVTVEYNTILGYAIIVLKEVLTGLLIGFGANMCTYIISFAGHLIDMETGLSMVTLFDPATNDNVTISGALYQQVVTVMLFITGLYQFVLQALKESFQLIPINGAIFSSDRLLEAMLLFLRDYISIGFRICLPVFCTILMLNCILGILAKISPQMNMFAVGIQLKVLTGLLVLFLTVSMLPSVSTMILNETQKVVTLFVEAML